MNGKKVRNGLLIASLCGVMGISGIMAYFTDGDSMDNTFTVGKISLDLKEPNWEEETAKDITPNQVLKKDPVIENNGINDEYVFLEIVMPYEHVVTANKDGTKNPAADTELFSYVTNKKWVQVGSSSKDTAEKTVTYVYGYGTKDTCTVLEKDHTTPSLFDTVTFANVVEDQDLEGTNQDIIVNAYGIQTTDVNEGKTSPSDVWSVLSKQSPSLSK